MLVVKLELHSARTGEVTEIGRMIIHNVSGGGKGRYDKRADYVAEVYRKGRKNQIMRVGKVENYPRLSYNVWRLVARSLLSAFPEEDAPRAPKALPRLMKNLQKLSDMNWFGHSTCATAEQNKITAKVREDMNDIKSQ